MKSEKYDLLKKLQPRLKQPAKKVGAFWTLVFCLLIAIFSWLLISLSKTYSKRIGKKVSYENLPKGRTLTNFLPDTFFLDISASGFALLAEQLKDRNQILQINLGNLSVSKQIESSSELKISAFEVVQQLAPQLNSDLQINGIFPDTLLLNFKPRTSKRVTVLPDLSLSYRKNYFLNGLIKIQPDSVTIYGSREDLANINYIETEKLMLKELESTACYPLRLRTTKNISSVPEEVQITIPVEQFTEVENEFEIIPLHLPSNLKVKLIPSKIKVSFVVSLPEFKKMNSNSMKSNVDFDSFGSVSSGTKEVTITGLPIGAQHLHINPSQVDFILYK